MASKQSSVRAAALLCVSLIAACAMSAPGPQIDGLYSAAGAYLSGRYALDQNDPEAAGRFYRRALQASPDDEVLLARALNAALASGRTDVSLSYAERLQEIDPDHNGAAVLLAASALREGRPARARALIEDSEFGPLNETLAVFINSWSYVGEGNFIRALNSLAEDNSARVFKGFHPLHRALILDLSGDPEAAEQAYQAALRAATPGLAQAALGISLERSGDADRARALYERILSEAPRSGFASAGIARLDAGVQPAPYVDDAPAGVALAFFNLAALLGRDAAFETRLLLIEAALWMSEDLYEAELYRAELYSGEELWAEAAAAFSKIGRGSPYYESGRLGLANSLYELDRKEQAIEILKTMSNDPDVATARAKIALGDLLRREERFLEAAEVYQDALSDLEEKGSAQERWPVHFARGMAFERGKAWDQAELEFEQALRLSPDQPFVLNYLGYTWIDRGENLDRGLEMIQKALEQRPLDGAIMDSLGWAHYRLGDFDEAVRRLESAVELEPGDPTINDHLGDAYWRVGRRLEARYQWRRALVYEPEPDLVEKIKVKLESGLEDI